MPTLTQIYNTMQEYRIDYARYTVFSVQTREGMANKGNMEISHVSRIVLRDTQEA